MATMATSDNAIAGPIVSAAEVASSSAYQQSALADALVTRIEYEDAFNREVTCLEERLDVEVNGPYWDTAELFMSYDYEVEGPPAVNDTAILVEQACSLVYRSLVELVWSEQQAPTEQARLRMGEELSTCLAATGAPEFDGIAPESIPDALAALDTQGFTDVQRDCVEQYKGYFAAPRMSP